MTLVLACSLDDPQALWEELEGHWRRGSLVGLAPRQEQCALRDAVLGESAAIGDTRDESERDPAGSQTWTPPIPPATGQPAWDDLGRRPERSGPAPEHGKQWPGGDDAEGTPAGIHGRQQATSGSAPPGEDAPAGSGGSLEPALVLGSGGSSGGRRWCLQPLEQLRASARACGLWLTDQDIDPERCLHLDALPLHHVSGLMPLIRVREWGAKLRWLPPGLLRQPAALPQACPLPGDRPVLLSLVPTQLHRLLESPEAVAWLRGCAVIWVGGAALGADLAARARAADLPLAPCYGATETAAMVCALPPRRFLAGEQGCGAPLQDVELRLEGEAGVIAVRSARLSPGWFAMGRLHPFRDAEGWWRSGDAAEWLPLPAGEPQAGRGLRILGRLDGAILSGGETVFPEQVRQRLLLLVREAGLPVAELLLLGESDPQWGERLVALVRWTTADAPGRMGAGEQPCFAKLAALARALPPSQRPARWLNCPSLATSDAGKWQLSHWRQWLLSQPAEQH